MRLKIKKIWAIYFIIKVFYLFFAIYVYSKLTTLGDTFDYLHSPMVFKLSSIYTSTGLMTFTGSVFKAIFINDALACLPALLLSFYGIYYAVDRLNLYHYSAYIILFFSLPNIGVWTSIHGKEAVGCFFCSVIAVILIKKFEGNYRLKTIDYLALLLCLIFKPQYLLFILQAIIYLTIVHRFKEKKYSPLFFGLFMISINLLGLYLLRGLIDDLARGMAIHFSGKEPGLAQSTRSEQAWLQPGGFFRSAPYGMFIAFFGPTLPEMIRKPAHFLSGVESLIMVLGLLMLFSQVLKYNILKLRFNPKLTITYFIVFVGILFIHYPFGFLNPGSAIRYRSNFYPLFVFLLLYLFDIYQTKKVQLTIN